MATAAGRLAHFARFTVVAGVVGLAVGLVRSVRRQPAPAATGTASWPPLVPEPEPAPRSGPVRFTEQPEPLAAEAATDPAPGWVEPVDGACPDSHPIKGNADSGIYHVPGGMSYERTHAERCYCDAETAEADGFRRAKR